MPFGLKCVFICYINYSKKLPKVFISLTSGIRAHGGVRRRWWGVHGPYPAGIEKALNGPHTKILEKKKRKKKPNKGILLMMLNNVVMRGSHGHGRAGFPWMCVRSWHVVPMDGVRETHGWRVDEVKSSLGKGEWEGLVHGPQRGLKAHREADSHVRGRLLDYTCEWNSILNKDEKNEWLI